MVENLSSTPIIRAITPSDFERIVEIDTRVLGQERPEFWKTKLEFIDRRSPMSSLVAEIEGQVIGFVIGDASGWEYGVPENIGWIVTIGVDPSFQRKGIAKMLLTEMINNLKEVGVNKIYTLVNWRNWSLLEFFDSIGFKKGDMINLELNM